MRSWANISTIIQVQSERTITITSEMKLIWFKSQMLFPEQRFIRATSLLFSISSLTVLVSLDIATSSSYPITYDMWLFSFGGKLKLLNTHPSKTFFITRAYRGLRPPLRISKLSVVELSGKDSGSPPTSSRDWYGVLLFDAFMRDQLPDFSEIDNI